jgi:uncharacterized protein
VWVEWDEGKADANLRKHGIDFADAVTVLHDELAVTIREQTATETRVVTIGSDVFRRVLVVVYAWRGTNVRLVSARRATRRERRAYDNRR